MSELPEGWAEIALPSICKKITDGTHHSPINLPQGDFKYVTAKNIRPWGLDLGNISYVDAATHKEIYARCPVEKGDVLYIKDGATTGLAVVNPLDEPFSMLSSVALLKPNMEAVESKYLKYWLNSPSTLSSMLDQMTGTAIRRLTLTTISTQRVPLAPLLEQRRIVAKVDGLTARTARARADLFRIPILIARYKQRLLALSFRGNAESMVPLEAVVDDALIGLVRSKQDQSDTDGVPYIRMQHYDLDGCWNSNNITFVAASEAEKKRFALRKDDLLFNTRNSVELVGKVALCSDELSGHLYNNNLLRIRFSKEVLPSFAFRQMQAPAFRALLEQQKSATTSVAALYQRNLFQTPLWVPPLAEQAEIVRRIDSAFSWLDRMAGDHAAAARLIPKLDAAILNKAFRGELVPQDPNDEPVSVLLERARTQREATPNQGRGKRAGTVLSSTARLRDEIRLPPITSKGAKVTKSRNDPDVKGAPYLANILRRMDGSARAEELYTRADLELVDFYKQLSEEHDRGWLVDDDTSVKVA